MERTNNELTAIFMLRVQRDSWPIRQGASGLNVLCPPPGHPWTDAAAQWWQLEVGSQSVSIPSYAFRDDPEGWESDLEPKQSPVAPVRRPAEIQYEQFMFVGGSLHQMVCKVMPDLDTAVHDGETYVKHTNVLGGVPFYASLGMPDNEAAFFYYMAVDNGDSPTKFSRN
jgi:hypothetical protein